MSESRPLIALGLEDNIALRGGVNVLVEALLVELKKYFRVALISTDDPKDVPAPLMAQLDGHFVWSRQTSVAQARRLASELRAAGVEVVHLHGGTFGWGMRFLGHSPIRHLRRAGVKVFWTNHTWVSLFEGYCGPQKPWWFKLGFLPLAWFSRVRELAALEAVLTVSELTRINERFYYWPVRGKFQRQYYSRLSEATLPSTEPAERTVVSVGHVAWRKGQLILAQAFAEIAARYPDWRLQIIGPVVEPEYGRQLTEFVAASGHASQIEILGTRSDAISFTRRAGIFVQPAIWEGLPLALQEAMFFERASLGTRCFGNTELIENESNGLLVPPERPHEMAAAIGRMIGDPALRARLGAAARPSIIQRGMTLEKMVESHRRLYENALASPR